MPERKIDNIIPALQNKPHERDLLDKLFNNSFPQQYSISNRKYFHRYFSLNLLANDIGHQEFESLFVRPFKELIPGLIKLNQRNSIALFDKLNIKIPQLQFDNELDYELVLIGLLKLFESIIDSDVTISQDGLNVQNLRILIIRFIKRVKIEDSKKNAYLWQCLNQGSISNLAASIFLHFDFVRLFVEQNEQRIELLKRVKEFQIGYLKNSLSDVDDVSTVPILQVLRSFVIKYTDGYHKDEEDWFKRILFENRVELKAKLTLVLDFITWRLSLQRDDRDEFREVSQGLVRSIFHSVDNVILFNINDIDPNVEAIIDTYSNLEIKTQKFLFVNQPPFNDDPENNDHFYPSNSDPKVYDSINQPIFRVIINPLETLYWRFGLKFSRNQSFEKYNKRHTDSNQHPYIVLVVGNPTEGSTAGPWFNSEGLYFSNYFTEIEKPPPQFKEQLKNIVFPEYMNEKVVFEVKRMQDHLELTFITKDRLERFIVRHRVKEYRYFQVCAWADRLKFEIEADIKESPSIPT